MNNYNYFSVSTKDNEDQLTNAVASYVFNLLSLGAKIPALARIL